MPVNYQPSRDYADTSNSARKRTLGIYIGLVKNTTDVQKNGRMQVWIPEIGGNPDDPQSWITIKYGSPFAGTTDYRNIRPDLKTMAGSQTSYGFWAQPPDINNQVVVGFVNGDAARGVMLCCLFAENMNSMVPGIPVNQISDSDPNYPGGIAPTVEYNKANVGSVQNPTRPTFTPLADGLATQGLQNDQQRGTSTTGARRESPSKVFGLLTPDQNSFSIDDNPANEMIRLRTRSGAQVMIHETTGYIYAITKGGNAWVEISDYGIDAYSKNGASIRTEGSFQVRADQNITLDCGGSFALRAGAGITMQSGTTTEIGAGSSLVLSSAAGNLTMNAQGDLLAFASGNLRTQSGSDTSQLAGGNQIRNGSQILDNSGSAPAAAANPAQVPQGKNLADIQAGKAALVNTIVTRMPTHEPWAGHPKANLPTTSGTNSLSTILARGGVGSTVSPNGTVTNPVTTGDGKTVLQTQGDGTKCALGVGTKSASTPVYNAIQTAAGTSGVPFGNLMAFADVESNFNPNAGAQTSSASGLFQFTSGTWSQMVSTQGAANNVSTDPSQIYDPTANAAMGAAYYNENAQALTAAGVSNPDCGQVYMCHMLGPTGGINLINAYNTDPSTPLSSVLSPTVIANNPLWFRGQTTVGDAYNHIDGTMNAKASAYDAQAGLPAPCDRNSGSGATAVASNGSSGSPGASSTGTPSTVQTAGSDDTNDFA